METKIKRTTNSKPIPHIPLPFKEVIADVLKVKPHRNDRKVTKRHAQKTNQQEGVEPRT
jgi:hypothetical protein